MTATAPEATTAFRKGRRTGFKPSASHGQMAALFLGFFAFYFAVGYRLVVVQHVVPFDAVARLAHAYFVWWNAPPKLAAIGFVWPPLSTLVFLPATAIRPLATSLVALPLTSAFFAALLIVLLDQVLAVARMRPLLRLPLLIAFGLNPMIVYYAGNGMSEAVYLCFLVGGVYFFVRWFLSREARWLVLAAVTFALGILSRYEVIGWAALLVLLLLVAMIRQRVSRLELEGTIIAYAAPIAYAVGLWFFLNWLILGQPLYFVSRQAPGFAQSTAAAPVVQANDLTVSRIVRDLVALTWELFPPTLVCIVVLVVVAAVRRDLMAAAVASFVALNTFFTGFLMLTSRNEGLLQLRYNMRGMPLVLVGVAWLYLTLPSAVLRRAVWAAALVGIVAAVPSTWHAMATYRFQFLESGFVDAVSSGKDQEGRRVVGGYLVGTRPERVTADWIRAHVTRRDEVLTDDGQTFAVMLMSARPDLFFDRIDEGDAVWLRRLDAPWGRYRYLLIASKALNDLSRLRYPGLLSAKGVPGFRLVYESDRYAVFRISASAPRLRPTSSRARGTSPRGARRGADGRGRAPAAPRTG